MGDLFHPEVKDEWLQKIFAEMYEVRRHVFLILTKRPKRMREFWENNFEIYGANTWWGVSVENQDAADERIPELLELGSWKRFISCEPLLEEIDISKYLTQSAGVTNWHGIKWVIAGGESGQRSRPCHPDWLRSLRDQCLLANVPFLFKQWGSWAPAEDAEKNDIYLTPDGRQFLEANAVYSGHCPPMRKKGKRGAGRKLDGAEWNQYPEF